MIDPINLANKLNIKHSKGTNYYCFNKNGHNHNDSKPSLSIDNINNKLVFNCFGCGIHGNAYDLVKLIYGYDISEAIKWINQNFGVNEYKTKEDYPQYQQKSEKVFVRAIDRNNKKRYIHLELDQVNFREVNESDLEYIRKELKKRFILDAFKLLRAGISQNSTGYFIVFNQKSNYIKCLNESNTTIYFEGQTDILTALSMNLHKSFNIANYFNKTDKVTLKTPINIFILDKDVTPSFRNEKIIKKPGQKVSYVKFEDFYQDFSDYINTENLFDKPDEVIEFIKLKANYDKLVESLNDPIENENTPNSNFNATKEEMNEETDTGNTRRFVEMYKDSVRYNHTNSHWYFWNGKNWDKNESKMIKQLAIASVEAQMSNPNIDPKWISKSLMDAKLESIVRLATTFQEFTIFTKDFDTNRDLVNLQNGMFDFRKCKLLPHDKFQYCTKILDINYNDKYLLDDAVEWNYFLKPICGWDQELVSFISRLLYISFWGQNTEQIFIFCYGKGKNGKSSFFHALEMLFGDYMNKIPSKYLMLNDNNNSTSDYFMADLVGSRLVVSSEISEGEKLDTAKVKDMTGNDRMKAREPYGKPFNFLPQWTLWGYGNYHPKVTATDFGFWRRVILLPFTETILPEDERNPMDLQEDLYNERDYIFAWIVKYGKQYLKRGLDAPKCVVDAGKRYREESEVLGDFYNDCLIFDEEYLEEGERSVCEAKDVYGLYNWWCKNNNYFKPMGNRTFYSKITDKNHCESLDVRKHLKLAGVKIIPEVFEKYKTSMTQKELFKYN